MKQLFFVVLPFVFLGCSNSSSSLFELMDDSIGIEFNNTLSYTEEFNPYTYRNFYNGAGVSLGDINNDGLIDIYFTGNIVNNKLFLNKGNWKFEDITDSAGVACPQIWSTGSTFVDINGDGLLDLYVCKSGKPGGNNRHNELFINQGDLTFKESSKDYGLDITGLSVHSAFLDYDKDGDLDVYILNNSIRSVGGYDLIKDQRNIPDPNNNGNKFLENKNGYFVDITEKAGMFNSAIGFGLGITVSDFNNDTWPDLFISNDFFEKDYLYINSKNGTFVESSDMYFDALSMGSMGADAADLDNDLNSDILVTEMLPSSLKRKKTKAMYDSWDKFKLMESNGYAKQFPRNVLQRNIGNNSFLEIGRKSGVAATEWSWASLLFDMDNDGLRDIFIANGINKDLLDRDYLAYMANDEQVRMLMKKKEEVVKKLIDIMPSKAVPNFVYKNQGDFLFEEVSTKWGLDQPSFSNGNSYADLDNDGDLDLVVNNVNMKCFVYQNKTDTLNKRSIQIQLIGDKKNSKGIGSKLILYNGIEKYMAELFPSRGFQSSVSHRIHFGIGSDDEVDSLEVTWPNGDRKLYKNLKSNSINLIKYSLGEIVKTKTEIKNIQKNSQLFNYKHIEDSFIEFNRERLLMQMRHNEGPALAVADLNKDGVDDVYIGGGKNQSSSLFMSNHQDTYNQIKEPFLNDSESEDTNALFFDGDNDGDLDLVVASGGKSFSKYSLSLNDRYYINNGLGNFEKKKSALNFNKNISTKALASADVNNDGKIDIFFGERYDLTTYGKKGSGVLMINDGQNSFTQTNQKVFSDMGMITDAKFHDFNGDNWPDLIIVGEWMPITILINKNGIFENHTDLYGLNQTSGLWNTIELIDINNDGQMDFLAGNHGTNSFLEKRMRMYINDFDANGSYEQIICLNRDGVYYPILDKDELMNQLPEFKKNTIFYKDYAEKSIEEIVGKLKVEESSVLEIDILKTSLFVGKKDSFNQYDLPEEIQYSPIYSILIKNDPDTNKNSLYLGGNQYLVKPQFGSYDASRGWVLPINSDSEKYFTDSPKSLGVKGQIRGINALKNNKKEYIIFAINNDSIKFHEPH
tara:strand:- start:6619 stop:9864 length:3246 start_codon:yes stop_codon:yes gene_type:complete